MSMDLVIGVMNPVDFVSALLNSNALSAITPTICIEVNAIQTHALLPHSLPSHQ